MGKKVSAWDELLKQDLDEVKKRSKRRAIALWSFAWVYFALVVFVLLMEIAKIYDPPIKTFIFKKRRMAIDVWECVRADG